MRSLAGILASHAPRPLALWVTAQVSIASVLLLVVALTTSIDTGIALPWSGLRPDVALSAGLTFWLAFGLIGGVRTRLQPGGGVVTFSMPFIVAGTMLGGPLAGGLMGLVSELEVRELRTQPWYGILSNHAVGIIAAIAAGVIGRAVGTALDQSLPGQQAISLFLSVMTAALVFATVDVAFVLPTLAIRKDLTIREAARISDATFRATTVAEAILAWNLVVSYQLVGWWAPIAIVALVLAVWQAFDRGEELRHDKLTGLLNDLAFEPLLDAAVRKARAGGRPAALLSLDLDGLWEVNLDHGLAAGDEFLRACAQRMFGAVRATDVVSRRSSTGDEFAVLLDDITDVASAVRVADRIQKAVRQPIYLRGQGGRLPMEPGVSIGVVLIERGTTKSPAELAGIAERRLLDAKVRGGKVVTRGDGPGAEAQRRYRDAKTEKRDRERRSDQSTEQPGPATPGADPTVI